MERRPTPSREPPRVERYRGALLAGASGDALGMPVEFMARGSFPPVRRMRPGRRASRALPAGTWTDDTSMTRCLARSFVDNGWCDLRDQMARYLRWLHDGEESATGRAFGVGRTTLLAMSRYERTGDPFAGDTDPRAAGNGALMRLAPAVLAAFPDEDRALEWARLTTLTTHAAEACVEASRIFARVLCAVLRGEGKGQILSHHPEGSRLAEVPRAEVVSSGHALRTLHAALWAFATTSTLEEAVLTAVNLGDDADTVACVTGHIAGAFYGEAALPPEWRVQLVEPEVLSALADGLLRVAEEHALNPSTGTETKKEPGQDAPRNREAPLDGRVGPEPHASVVAQGGPS